MVDKSLSPNEQVSLISKQKALDVFSNIKEDCIVIGSDTLVVSRDGEILGKPKDEDDARRMLRKLSNDFHDVMTGLTIITRKDGNVNEYTTCDITKVHINELNSDEIDRWISSGNAMDKAGAYAIQQEFGVHVDKIDGNYSVVMGLPIHLVYNELKKYIF